MCSHEDDQIALNMLVGIGAEKSSYERNIPDNRCSIFGFLDVFAHQPAEYDSRSVINAYTRSDFARAEDRLINDIRSNNRWWATDKRTQ